jgi:hypothetical protein
MDSFLVDSGSIWVWTRSLKAYSGSSLPARIPQSLPDSTRRIASLKIACCCMEYGFFI